MIVCSCNVLSDTQILATLGNEEAGRPRSPAQAYNCLGCAPRCGRCLPTVRALLADARVANCHVGCAVCPGAEHSDDTRQAAAPFLIAAE
jgi:bacterioferritin-associated ferredoxin